MFFFFFFLLSLTVHSRSFFSKVSCLADLARYLFSFFFLKLLSQKGFTSWSFPEKIFFFSISFFFCCHSEDYFFNFFLLLLLLLIIIIIIIIIMAMIVQWYISIRMFACGLSKKRKNNIEGSEEE